MLFGCDVSRRYSLKVAIRAVPPKIQLVEEPQKIEPTANVEKEKITPEAKTTDRVFSDNDEECTFDSFLTDDTNEYAFRLAQTIAEEPGNPKRNPLPREAPPLIGGV